MGIEIYRGFLLKGSLFEVKFTGSPKCCYPLFKESALKKSYEGSYYNLRYVPYLRDIGVLLFRVRSWFSDLFRFGVLVQFHCGS